MLIAAAASQAFAEVIIRAAVDERHRHLLEMHCQKCHGPESQEGQVRLDNLPLAITTVESAERWQKVLNVMNSGDMPPEEEPQPDGPAKADFLDNLAHVMVAARKSLGDQRGSITMRRLNRREYKNTLRELLGAEINVSELPADTGNGNFDTVGANLFMSGNQFEQYHALGREAVEEAFARHAARATVQKYRYEAEGSLPRVVRVIHDEIEGKERADRWVKAVSGAAARPENERTVAELRQASKSDSIFRRSWSRISGAPAPELFGFISAENSADKANGAANPYHLPYHEHYLKQPSLDTGAYLAFQTLHPSILDTHYLWMVVPHTWQPGDFTVRIRLAGNQHATSDRRFIEFGIHPRFGQVLSTHEVTGTMHEPQVIEIPLTLTRKHADTADRTLFIREKASLDTNEQAGKRFNEGKKANGIGPEYAIWIDWMEVERRQPRQDAMPAGLAALGIPVDDKTPVKKEDLRAAFQRFCLEAFRGTPPPESFIDRLLVVYDIRRTAGDKHPAALKETLAVALASPMFLYLAEPSAGERLRPLTDAELAARLSYFLWGAPPDSQLRELAAGGKLARPDVLAMQTERLLDDPRSEGFLKPFIYQWLGLDRLDFFQINRDLYPAFDDSTRLAAKNEVYETMQRLLRENGSVRDLLKADYVVVNNVLARYYGIDGIQGDVFRKVPLPEGSPRGGLLGMAAVNLMGGNGEQTSPVERGAWVLRKLLDAPPPPAPANVPAISRLADKVVTPRERLRLHQEQPQCASCHRTIDPIGLGLENFDAVGQWRTEERYRGGTPWKIEPAGALHNGPAFRDYFELRDIIASEHDAFARGISRALVEYALGRPCGFGDEPLVEAMIDRSKTKNFPVREFIQALVASEAFHSK